MILGVGVTLSHIGCHGYKMTKCRMIITLCLCCELCQVNHYRDVIMGAKASGITSLSVVYSTVYSDADQRKHQSSASLAIVRGIQRGPVNSPHKWPVTRKMFPFDDVIMSEPNMACLPQRVFDLQPFKLLGTFEMEAIFTSTNTY